MQIKDSDITNDNCGIPESLIKLGVHAMSDKEYEEYTKVDKDYSYEDED